MITQRSRAAGPPRTAIDPKDWPSRGTALRAAREARTRHLRATADHHREVALAHAAEPDAERSRALLKESADLASAAGRVSQSRRAPLVARARRAERLGLAHATAADPRAALTHAAAAESLHALVEGRPARPIGDVLVHLGLRAPPAPAELPAEADDGPRRARAAKAT